MLGLRSLLQNLSDALQLLNGLSSFKLHQFSSVAGFNPTDAEIRHQKPHHVRVPEISHERGSMAITPVTTDVASCRDTFAL